MTIDFQLQELNFTLFTEKLDPAMFNLNVLQRIGAIKSSWQLAQEPVYQTDGIKFVFNNKMRIFAQSDRLIFIETVGNKRLQDTQIAQAAINTVRGFPQVKYHTASLSPGGYADFASLAEARKYLSEGLLASTPWGKFQGQGIDAVGLKLGYCYKSGKFYLDISQVNLNLAGREVSAVWFAGKFNYQLLGKNSEDKYRDLNGILRNWQFDIQNYQSYINNKLLAASVIPSLSVFPL